jgi:transcriptional regulator with XRE-family HTH domain
MKYSNKTFPKALKEIIDKKNVALRKLAAKTNYSFCYFSILKKRKNHPPLETIENISEGLGIPPEYFLEYRINKLTNLLMDNPEVTDDILNYANDQINNNKGNEKDERNSN